MAQDDNRSLTELEFVEVAARRAAARHRNPAMSRAFTMLADELQTADISELNGGGDTRLSELRRLRRIQQ
jgi:hypothetical protein